MAASTVVLDDFSPLVHYSPTLTATQSLASGWSARFNGQFLSPGSTGSTSSHETSLEGAGFSIAWQGTSIALYGTADGSYDLVLDGVSHSSTSQGALLAHFSNLTFAPHNVTLRSHSTVAFTRAELAFAAPPDLALRSLDPSSWTFSGDWQSAQPDGVQTTSRGDSVSITFYGAAVQLTGLITPDGGLYNATLDGVTSVLNASAPWTVESTLFAQTGLDVAQHTLTVTNAESGKALLLRSAAVAEAPLPPSSPAATPTDTGSATDNGLPKGTVVALIVGAAVAFVCLMVFVGLIWRHYRRRRRTRRQRQRRADEVVDLSADYFPPPAPPPSLVRYPRAPPPPLDLSSRPPSSLDYDSRVNSPDSRVNSPDPPSLRAKIAKTLMPHLRDGSSSSGRSLSRRSYLRSLNSLHQHYLYDSRDRDDVAFNTPDDPDAGFRVHDEPVHDPDDGASGDFDIDADAIFNALSKTPEGSPKNSVREQRGHRGNNRAPHASFLEFTTSSSSGHHSHSARTSSFIRSMTASEISGTEVSASANIPYFVPMNQVRSSGNPTTAGNRRSSLSFLMTHQPQRSLEGQGTMEMAFPRSRTGVISFSQTIDTDFKTPSDSVPRSVSPGQLIASPPEMDSGTRGTSAVASAGHTPAPVESEQFYTVASGMEATSHTGGGSSSSDPPARPAIPSGQSSQFLAHHLQTSSGSPVPSSIDVRGEPSSIDARGDPSPSTSVRRGAPMLPPLPPPGPPPSLPHPFAVLGPAAPTGAPPVQVHVLPASPPASPADRRSPSPPPWPLPTRSHKERVLRRILGVDSSSRPPVPDFDR